MPSNGSKFTDVSEQHNIYFSRLSNKPNKASRSIAGLLLDKSRLTFTRPHGFISEETVPFTVDAVGTSNSTRLMEFAMRIM